MNTKADIEFVDGLIVKAPRDGMGLGVEVDRQVAVSESRSSIPGQTDTLGKLWCKLLPVYGPVDVG